jgi:hypothetical protein
MEEFPRFEEKQFIPQSGLTTLRRREPTNEQTASKHPNMVWEYSKQQAVLPDRLPKVLIESTQQYSGPGNYRTMNASGKPYALDVMVGGSPDTAGSPLSKQLKQKMTEKARG